MHTVGKGDSEFEESSLPDRVMLAGNATLPDLEVQNTGSSLLRSGIEAEGVVFAPLLPVREFSSQRVCAEQNQGVRMTYRSSWRRFWQRAISSLVLSSGRVGTERFLTG